jgi:hypothetical protein
MKILLLILVFFLSSGHVFTQDDSALENNRAKEPARIRARLAEKDVVYIGPKVTLWVDVMTNTWFTAAPDVGEVRVHHAVTLQLSQFAINFTERIEGDTWAAQRREFVIYPQRVGDYHVPSIEVKLTYARPGKAAGKATLRSPPLSFSARIPPGAEGIKNLVTTPKLIVSEIWDKKLKNLRVGDSLTRTITLTADDTVGMLLPDIRFSDTEGLALYPQMPLVSENVERGVSTGKRVESVTYVLEKAGEYTLPKISVYWWEDQTRTLHHEILPEYHFSVAQNPDLEAGILTSQEKEKIKKDKKSQTDKKAGIDLSTLLMLVLAGLLIVVLIWFIVIPGIRRFFYWRKRKKEIRAESEKAYFRSFRRACLKKDNQFIMSTLMAWLDRFYSGTGAVTLAWLGEHSRDTELKIQIEGLETELFGKTAAEKTDLKWSPKKLFSLVSGARNKLIKKEKPPLKTVSLRTLNP